MKKTLLRPISLLLIGALIADPRLSALAESFPAPDPRTSIFLVEALAPLALAGPTYVFESPLSFWPFLLKEKFEGLSILRDRPPSPGDPAPQNNAPDHERIVTHFLDKPSPKTIPFIKKFSWIPFLRKPIGDTVIRTIEQYQTLYPDLTGETELRLELTSRSQWEHTMRELLGIEVHVYSNNNMDLPDLIKNFRDTNETKYTPVVAVHHEFTKKGSASSIREFAYFKESLFAIPDVLQRNRNIAWLGGYAKAVLFLTHHPRLERLLTRIAKALNAEHPFDSAAFFVGYFYYRKIWGKARALKMIPPITLDHILNTAHLESAKDRNLVKLAYRFRDSLYKTEKGDTDRLYPSGISVFADNTNAALGAAQLNQGADAIVAVLLRDLDDGQFGQFRDWCHEQDKKTDYMGRILGIANLTSILQRTLQEPFNPDIEKIKENVTDFSIQDYTGRMFQRLGRISKETGVDFNTLLAMTLAAGHREILQADPDSGPEKLTVPCMKVLIYAHVLDLMGRADLAMLIQDSVFKLYAPADYERVRKEYRAKLPLTNKQAEDELEQIENRLTEVLTSSYGLGPVEVLPLSQILPQRRGRAFIKSRVKSYFSAFMKTGGDDPTPIDAQEDLLALMVVVDTPEDLERIRERLDTEIGAYHGQIQRLPDPDRVRPISSGGRIVRQIMSLRYQKKDGQEIVFELQLMTRDHYINDHLFGRSEAKYHKAHAERFTARVFNELLLKKAPKHASSEGQQFDLEYPVMTGNFREDAEALLNLFNKRVYPTISLDPSALTTRDFNSVKWFPLHLPENAVLADLLFHPDVGFRPDAYPQAYRLMLTGRPNNPVIKMKLGLDDQILPADRIVFDFSPAGKRPLSDPHPDPLALLEYEARLFTETKTPSAKIRYFRSYLLAPFRQRQPDMDTNILEGLIDDAHADYVNAGRNRMMEMFGDLNDPTFRVKILEPLLKWQGFKGDEDGFYLAVGMASDDPFRYVKDWHPPNEPSEIRAPMDAKQRAPYAKLWKDVGDWYAHRYVQFEIVKPEDLGDQIYLNIHADEDQVGLIADMTDIMGLKVIDDFQAKVLKGGRSGFTFRIPKRQNGETLDIDGVKFKLAGLRRERREKPTIAKGERLRIDLTLVQDSPDRPAALRSITKHLSKLNIFIESGKQFIETDETNKPKEARLILDVVAPLKLKGHPNSEVVEALALEFHSLHHIVKSASIGPAPLSPADFYETRRILAKFAKKYIPREFWGLMPVDFNPDKILAWPPSDPDAMGQTDAFGLERLEAILENVVVRFHPPEDNDIALQHLREEYKAPYLVHLLEATWFALERQSITFPEVYAQLAHDIKEDGVKQYVSKQVEKERTKPDPADRPATMEAWNAFKAAARTNGIALIEEGIRSVLPRYSAEWTLALINAATHEPTQSYTEYIYELFGTRPLGVATNKVDDQRSDISHLDREEGQRAKRIGKRIRYLPAMLDIKRFQDEPDYLAKRDALLKKLILEAQELPAISAYQERDNVMEDRERIEIANQKTIESIDFLLLWMKRHHLARKTGFNNGQVRKFMKNLEQYKIQLSKDFESSPPSTEHSPGLRRSP